jgi:CRP-like cAMP-binding protein
LFDVTQGIVRVSKALPDGRRQITGFLYSGDLLGVTLHDTYVYDAEAITAVTLCRFPKFKLQSLFNDFPKLERHLLSMTANELAAAPTSIHTSAVSCPIACHELVSLDFRSGSPSDYRHHHPESSHLEVKPTKSVRKRTSALECRKLRVNRTCPSMTRTSLVSHK